MDDNFSAWTEKIMCICGGLVRKPNANRTIPNRYLPFAHPCRGPFSCAPPRKLIPSGTSTHISPPQYEEKATRTVSAPRSRVRIDEQHVRQVNRELGDHIVEPSQNNW